MPAPKPYKLNLSAQTLTLLATYPEGDPGDAVHERIGQDFELILGAARKAIILKLQENNPGVSFGITMRDAAIAIA